MQTSKIAPTYLGFRKKMAVYCEVARLKGKEYASFDSFILKKTAACLGLFVGLCLLAFGKIKKGFSILSSLHRANYSAQVDKVIEKVLQGQNAAIEDKKTSTNKMVYQEHIDTMLPTPATSRFFLEPEKVIGSRVLVLKSPRENEKGVIVIDYSFVFPLLAKFFDIQRIAEQYHLVLEPSWSGYCDLDILCYGQYDFPVFVQAFEPRDAAFIRHMCPSFIPVPLANNWWVDYRVLKPLPEVKKDVDIIMIAGWAGYKRHHRFFAALARLRAQGERPRVVLIGYPTDYTRKDIADLARYFGIDDQVDMYEQLSPEEVNQQLNRAKVNVIWSRKEGWNRAIIEGMFAGVPCVLRQDHNYGFPYPYINAQTGCYAHEHELAERLLWMIQNYEQFSPRQWVMANMTCQHATAILGDTIRRNAVENGEQWTQDLAVKVSYLNTMRYWEAADMHTFEADYAFLRATRRH